MSTATRTDAQSSALHVADSHDLIRVQGARENNLKDVSVEIPKRRLTVFTGVSGSGKSSLVFGTIAAESQRLINETYSAFVQGFMPTLARPDVDVLDGLTTAIIVDQERMGANSRSTVGTATDANAMLRIVFSRLGEPHIGSPHAFTFNVASAHGPGRSPSTRAGQRRRCDRASPSPAACARAARAWARSPTSTSPSSSTTQVARRGRDHHPRLQGRRLVVRIFAASGFVDPDKPIRDYTEQELHDFLYKEPVKVKVNGINMTYEGLVPKVQKSFLSKDKEALQPHIRAFVDRAVTFTACPDCGGTRLNEAPARRGSTASTSPTRARCRSATSPNGSAASTSRRWRRCWRRCSRPSTRSCEIGLGYLSLDRPSGTLSGGEAQRTKMIRHLGSSLTDVTYVFDEPTIGLHPHDIQRMNDLLLRLRDKGNTVLVVEHKPETIAIADHVVDLGPGAGRRAAPSASRAPSRGCGPADTLTGRHLDYRAALKPRRCARRPASWRSATRPRTTCATSTSTSRSACCAS